MDGLGCCSRKEPGCGLAWVVTNVLYMPNKMAFLIVGFDWAPVQTKGPVGNETLFSCISVPQALL